MKQNNLTEAESATRETQRVCSLRIATRDAAKDLVKAMRAAYEGGPGAVALMARSAAVNAVGSGVGVSLNVGYTYADGYSANAGVAAGGVVTRVSWSEEGGYHYGVGLGNNQLNALYTWGGEGDQKTHGWSAALGPLELRHDAIRGYGASFTMSSVYTGGGMGIGVGTTLSYDQRGGFSNSVGFTFTTNSAMIAQMEANAQSRANAMNDVNNGMMLRVLEGLGFAVTRRPDEQGNFAEESPFYNETFGSKGILNSMGNAWNSVSNFVSDVYNKMFGTKQVVMMPAMEVPGNEKELLNQIGKDRTLENILTGNIDPKSAQGMQMILALEALGLLDQTVKATNGIPSDSTDQLPEDMKKQLLSTADRLTAKNQDGSITASELSLLKGIFNTFSKYGIEHPGMWGEAIVTSRNMGYQSPVSSAVDIGNAMQTGSVVKDLILESVENADKTKALTTYSRTFGIIGAGVSAIGIYKIIDEANTKGQIKNSDVANLAWVAHSE